MLRPAGPGYFRKRKNVDASLMGSVMMFTPLLSAGVLVTAVQFGWFKLVLDSRLKLGASGQMTWMVLASRRIDSAGTLMGAQ